MKEMSIMQTSLIRRPDLALSIFHLDIWGNGPQN